MALVAGWGACIYCSLGGRWLLHMVSRYTLFIGISSAARRRLQPVMGSQRGVLYLDLKLE